MKVLSFVLLSFCLLCGAGGWRAFEAPALRADLDRAIVAIDKAAESAADQAALPRARQEYWGARSRVSRLEEIARGCFMAALVFGLSSMVVLAYGEQGRPVPAPSSLATEAHIADLRHWSNEVAKPIEPKQVAASSAPEEAHAESRHEEAHEAVPLQGKGGGEAARGVSCKR